MFRMNEIEGGDHDEQSTVNRAELPPPPSEDPSRSEPRGSRDSRPRGPAGDVAARTRSDASSRRQSQDSADDEGLKAELIEEQVERAVERYVEQYISGPVPDPQTLSGYTEDHQERIFRMAESFTTDESGRRNTVVGSTTKVAERQQWITPVTLLGAFVFAAGTYAAYQNVVFSALFLSVPVLRVVGSSVATAVRRRQAAPDEEK